MDSFRFHFTRVSCSLVVVIGVLVGVGSVARSTDGKCVEFLDTMEGESKGVEDNLVR